MRNINTRLSDIKNNILLRMASLCGKLRKDINSEALKLGIHGEQEIG